MEFAMSTMNPSIPLSQGSRLSKLGRHFAEWRGRARSRNELKTLSDECLRDIGVSRADARTESYKPFWMA